MHLCNGPLWAQVDVGWTHKVKWTLVDADGQQVDAIVSDLSGHG